MRNSSIRVSLKVGGWIQPVADFSENGFSNQSTGEFSMVWGKPPTLTAKQRLIKTQCSS